RVSAYRRAAHSPSDVGSKDACRLRQPIWSDIRRLSRHPSRGHLRKSELDPPSPCTIDIFDEFSTFPGFAPTGDARPRDPRSMLTPKELLSRFGGIARGIYLQQYGCTRDHLAAAVQAGEIRRVRPGVFALP